MSVETAKEQRGFESEVAQLLDLVINSLYSNREIFLRELVSNAADAADKLRFAALTNDELYENDSDLGVTIDYSEKLKTITVRDNGIGMSRDEVIENLGTIAKSGTREFFGALSGDAKKDSQLIGQFGVGFYAAFIVADKVVVTSRRAGLPAEEGVRWESDGGGEYSVETVLRKKRGTEIVLHLKDDATEFADAYRLRQICKRYSDHISVPVRMPVEGDGSTDAGDEDAATEGGGYEVINAATAMWQRAKNEISDEEYTEFYKHVAHDFSDPMSWVHSKVEGKLDYTTLFYIPGQAPFDLWDRDAKHGVKLYVQRVFIMDDSEELLPRYLRFVRGVIDTSDLPLNVSREILQKNKTIDSIRAASVKRILGNIEALGDKYETFWSNFGRVIKEGIIEDDSNRERLAKLLRYASTFEDDESKLTSLEEYVGRMQDDADTIYYVTADSFSTAKNSPHLEYFRTQGIEVLLMHDPVDEWVVTHLREFEGKTLKSIMDAELDAVSDAAESTDQNDEQDAVDNADEPDTHAALLDKVKSALADQVTDVRVSKRLTDSPACLVSSGDQMSANLERILKSAGQDVPESKRILELNVTHPMVQMLDEMDDADRASSFCALLYEQSILAEGGKLDDPAGFVRRMNEVVLKLAGA